MCTPFVTPQGPLAVTTEDNSQIWRTVTAAVRGLLVLALLCDLSAATLEISPIDLPETAIFEGMDDNVSPGGPEGPPKPGAAGHEISLVPLCAASACSSETSVARYGRPRLTPPSRAPPASLPRANLSSPTA